MGTRQTRSAAKAQHEAEEPVEDSTEDARPPESSTFCQFLAQNVGKMSIERHRAALLGCQAATIRTLGNAIAKKDASIDLENSSREELVDVYLTILRGSTGAKSSSPAAPPRKVPASKAKQGSGSAPKRAAASSAPSAPFGEGDTIDLERCKFRFGKLLANGTDSTIYEGSCVEGKHAGLAVALKVQVRHKKTTIQVTQECNVLTKLRQTCSATPRIQTLVVYGCVQEKYYILVTRLLGPDLLHLLPSSQCLSPRNVLVAAYQGLEALESLHRAGFVHRDIKPENLVTEAQDGGGALHLIDFGTAEALCDREGRRRTGPQAVEGTLPYMSTTTQKKQPLSKRDDLQSLAWTLLKLYQGSLPWDGLGMKQAAEVCKMKEQWLDNGGAAEDQVVTALRTIATMSAECGVGDDPDYAGARRAVEGAWAAQGKKVAKTAPQRAKGGGLGAETFLWD